MNHSENRLLPQRVHRQGLIRDAENFRDHKKGIPEWLKNSDDSYARHEEISGIDFSDLPILINFNKKEILSLDFGGSTAKDMIDHIPHYFSPDAATLGKKLNGTKVSGGHGSGGKYYAIAQFEDCEIISYYKGKLTILRINKQGDYVDQEDVDTTPWDVIKLLGLNRWEYFEKDGKEIYHNLNKGKLDLFCWRGILPRDKKIISNRQVLLRVLSSISNHPQSRSTLRTRKVSALFEGKIIWPLMKPDEVKPDPAFGIREFQLPNKLEGYKLNKSISSVLKIVLSKEPLTGEKSSLNILEIDAFQKNIAYYDLPTLLLDRGLAKNLYACIDVPELKEYNCVSNDRMHLIENELTILFLDWCRAKLKDVMQELTDKEKKKEERKHLEELGTFLKDITDEISDLLEEDILKPSFKEGGTQTGIVLAPTDKPGYGGSGKIKQKGEGKRGGGTEEKETSNENKKTRSKLQILLSNHESDPLHPGKTFDMIERQPILHQRTEDVDYGIWWINSQKDYIKKVKIKDPGAMPFYFFLVKEIVLSHRTRRKFKEQERYDPDGLEELNFSLIDEIFSKTIEKLGIEISADQTLAEKIRKSIRSKERFTISEISEELNIDPITIHTFISNPSNGVLENYKISKEKNNTSGPPINVYIKK